MRELFILDAGNYNKDGKPFIRPSCRSIIIKNNKIALIHSKLYDYYKFPGGGIENNESFIDALVRETKEESGLLIIKESIKEYGLVRRIEKSNINDDYDFFVQDNYYYLCNALDTIDKQDLDDYEDKEQFTLEFIDPNIAIDVNLNKDHGPKSKIMILREAKVLQLLIDEGYFK